MNTMEMNTMIAIFWCEVPQTYTGIVFSKHKDKHWVVNGKRHRLDGPASEFVNGNKEWFKEGDYHREDGPAVEFSNGYKQWWIEGKLHREDGPACEFLDGTKEWWVKGKLHRLDGPAIEQTIGLNEWFLEGDSYCQISLKNYVVLDHYQGKYGIMWYKLLAEDGIIEYPDIPGLIIK